MTSEPSWLAAELRCPCPDRLPVAPDGAVWRCRAGCMVAPAGFPVVGGRPCLVDFDRSVIDRAWLLAAAGDSAVPRRHSVLRERVLGLAFGSNRIAPRNAEAFLAALPKRADGPIRVLIVGGGALGAGCERLYAATGVEVVAFDVYRSDLTHLIADGHAIPLADGSVDGVWIQAVLEHVIDPWRVAAEIHRVLVPKGVVYAETPFLQEVHEAAYDFTRFTESGHRWLFRNFEALGSGVVAGPGTSLLWAVRGAAAALFRSRKLGTLASLPFFWVRFLDRLMPQAFASDAANGVWFLGRRATVAIDAKQAIAGYRGAMGRSVS